jgi:hypothetical protein
MTATATKYQLNVWLDSTDAELLHAMAADTDRSKSAIVRRLIRQAAQAPRVDAAAVRLPDRDAAQAPRA